MVKFFFADLGSRDDALRLMDELASQAQALVEAFRSITASSAKGHVTEWHETGPTAAILGQRVQEENARLARTQPETR